VCDTVVAQGDPDKWHNTARRKRTYMLLRHLRDISAFEHVLAHVLAHAIANTCTHTGQYSI
jgi:hypothetical protein